MCLCKKVGKANDYLKEYKNILEIVLIAHVLEPRGYDNENQLNCPETEHFSINEFSDIYQGIVNAGYYINKIFFNELDFVIDISSNPKKYNNTVVFNLCRNGTGMNKKALIPAMCNLLNIAYTSSSAGCCALGRNKFLYTAFLSANGISCPITSLSAEETISNLPVDRKIIYKPNTGSASQNINNKSIITAVDALKKNNENYLFQEYIDGYECEVPIFCSSGKAFALSPVGISFNSGNYEGILSYDDSKNSNYGFYSLSEILSKDICKKIKHEAIKVFNLLNLEIYGRVDFRIDKKTDKHYLIDISTTPYITQHSSFAFEMKNQNCFYSDIFHLIIAEAIYRNSSQSVRN